MALTRIEGNLKQLPTVKCGKRDLSNAFRSWTIGGIGEVIAFLALHKAKFSCIVKPLMLQGMGKGNILIFISPNQLRQGLFWHSRGTERYYQKTLTEEQFKLAFRWDFLAMKLKAPCLIEVKTQSGSEPSDYYRLFKKRDFSREKQAGFRIFCLRVVLKENWDFETLFEEL